MKKYNIIRGCFVALAVVGMLLIGCFASMPSNLVGVLLPLQLKDGLGEAGATLYGYLNSLNGLVVIVFTPILTVVLKKLTEGKTNSSTPSKGAKRKEEQSK